MRILLIEPFFTGSHSAWAEGLRSHSRHEVEILSLPGRGWKWRMHGGALTLAREFLARDQDPDLILASDMLDLTTFLALTRHRTAGIPAVAYFHENQLAYPWSPQDRDKARGTDRHYGFINLATARAADRVLFNSGYNRDSFLAGLRDLLGRFRDFRELESIDEIAARSEILPLGLDLKRMDAHRPDPATDEGRPPLILWNHRWEHDKNPEGFFRVLCRLADRGLEFRVAVLGESPGTRISPIFEEAGRHLGDRVEAFGYADSFADYARWLWRADILPVTSYHDFFGISVMEALYCRTFPLLPWRQAYPELIPEGWREACFYTEDQELERRLEELLADGRAAIPDTEPLRRVAAGYDWSVMAVRYDQRLAEIAENPG